MTTLIAWAIIWGMSFRCLVAPAGGQQCLIQKLSLEVSQVHIPGLWPGVPGLPFPNTNS